MAMIYALGGREYHCSQTCEGILSSKRNERGFRPRAPTKIPAFGLRERTLFTSTHVLLFLEQLLKVKAEIF